MHPCTAHTYSHIESRCPATYKRLDDVEYNVHRVRRVFVADIHRADVHMNAPQEASWAETRMCKQTHHKALHATVPLAAGQCLCTFSHRAKLGSPNYLTVQVSPTAHILLSPAWLQNINHSCNPNVFFNTTTMQLECLRNVTPGEELTFFYPSTEWHMDAPFTCLCGSSECLQTIQVIRSGKYLVKIPREKVV